MSGKNELDQIVDKIFKSTQETEASKTLREIESNSDYILNTQLRKLLKLHDNSFQQKCIVPVSSLYEKHSELALRDGDLQNWAELIDRDIRIIETAMQLIKDSNQ